MLQLSKCVHLHGWVPEPPSLQMFRKQCVCAPVTPEIHFPLSLPDQMHVFTDGGCLSPKCPVSRLGFWGVVLALPDQSPWPLANGILPGWMQSVIRAEVWAATVACQAALQTRKSIMLWVDNQLLFKRLKCMQQMQFRVKPNQKDADLWNQLQTLVMQLGDKFLGVMKVNSHVPLDTACDEVELWALRANAAVDRLASLAVTTAPEIYRAWQQLTHDLTQVKVFRETLHRHIIQVGKAAVMMKATKPTVVPHSVPQHDRHPVVTLKDVQLCDVRDKFHCHLSGRFFQWVRDLQNHEVPPVYISWFQLNALWEYDSKTKGFDHSRKTRQWTAQNRKHVPNFVTRTNLFTRYLVATQRVLQPELEAVHVRPNSATIQFWTRCLKLRVEDRLVRKSDGLHSVSALRGIP